MIRAAFATGDGININRHFGVADRFDIYEIDTEARTIHLSSVCLKQSTIAISFSPRSQDFTQREPSMKS